MRKPVLIVIAGPNGSGKTSTTRLVIKHEWAESCLNAIRVTRFADRVYFYDNSVDNQNAQLLFRTTDGKFVKQYIAELPQWTESIIEQI